LPPFEYRRVWHIAQSLDPKILKSAAKHFVGTHDFASFAANRGKPEPSTIRKINSVRVRQQGRCVRIEFDGDGFLYKMVRLMTGALVKCALGKVRIEEITSRLHSGKVGSDRFVAPAEGLYLVRVRY
jgi:tRNA pseudouridine38-40 synthase